MMLTSVKIIHVKCCLNSKPPVLKQVSRTLLPSARQTAIPQMLLVELMSLCKAGQDAKQTKQCFENTTEPQCFYSTGKLVYLQLFLQRYYTIQL